MSEQNNNALKNKIIKKLVENKNSLRTESKLGKDFYSISVGLLLFDFNVNLKQYKVRELKYENGVNQYKIASSFPLLNDSDIYQTLESFVNCFQVSSIANNTTTEYN